MTVVVGIIDRQQRGVHLRHTVRANSNCEIEQLIDWCRNTLGERYNRWTYHGGRLWRFSNKDDAMLFFLTWG